MLWFPAALLDGMLVLDWYGDATRVLVLLRGSEMDMPVLNVSVIQPRATDDQLLDEGLLLLRFLAGRNGLS